MYINHAKNVIAASFMAASCCVGVASARAQDNVTTQDAPMRDATEDVVIVSAQHRQPVDANAQTTIVIAESRPSLYVGDALRQVPFASVSRSGGMGALTQVRLRGAEANHTQTLLNGINIADPITGETDFGLWSGLGDARIQVTLGEQSGFSGPDAIGGIVHIILPQVTSANVTLSGGNLGQESVQAAAPFGALAVMVSQLRTQGVDISGKNGERDGSDARAISTTWQSQWLGFDVDGLLSLRHARAQVDPDRDFDGVLDDANSEGHATQTIGGLSAQRRMGGLIHVASVQYVRVDRDQFDDDSLSEHVLGTRENLQYRVSGAASNIALSAAAEWQLETFARANVVDFFGDPNQRASNRRLAISGQASGNVANISWRANVRHDNNDGLFEESTTYRLSAAHDWGNDLRLFAAYGTGVKNPTFTEIFGYYPAQFVGNRQLRPEQSQGWELGLGYDNGLLAISANYFASHMRDEIRLAFNPDFTSTSVNASGTTKRSGYSVQGSLVLGDAHIQAQATMVDANDRNGQPRLRVPSTTASASWTQAFGQWHMSAYVDYVGPIWDMDFGSFSRVRIGNYALVGAGVSHALNDQWQVGIQIDNIGNVRAFDVYGYHQMGRNVLMTLRHQM